MMFAVEALLTRLQTVAPTLYDEVKDAEEGGIIETVSKAYALPTGVNPTDWAITILKAIDDGATPHDGSGNVGVDAEAPQPA